MTHFPDFPFSSPSQPVCSFSFSSSSMAQFWTFSIYPSWWSHPAQWHWIPSMFSWLSKVDIQALSLLWLRDLYIQLPIWHLHLHDGQASPKCMSQLETLIFFFSPDLFLPDFEPLKWMATLFTQLLKKSFFFPTTLPIPNKNILWIYFHFHLCSDCW